MGTGPQWVRRERISPAMYLSVGGGMVIALVVLPIIFLTTGGVATYGLPLMVGSVAFLTVASLATDVWFLEIFAPRAVRVVEGKVQVETFVGRLREFPRDRVRVRDGAGGFGILEVAGPPLRVLGLSPDQAIAVRSALALPSGWAPSAPPAPPAAPGPR